MKEGVDSGSDWDKWRDPGHVGHEFAEDGPRILPPDRFLHFAGLAHQSIAWTRCADCGHVKRLFTRESRTAIEALESSYQFIDNNLEEMKRTFERVLALSPAESDVESRSKDIQEFVADWGLHSDSGTLAWLDFGAGLGVLQQRVIEKFKQSIEAYLFEPDLLCQTHLENTFEAHENINLLRDLEGDLPVFGLVSAVNVLEHLQDPKTALQKLRRRLASRGGLFLEVPSSVNYVQSRDDHSSLNSLHYRLWSRISIENFLVSCGFSVVEVSEITQPSGKNSLRAFAVKNSH